MATASGASGGNGFFSNIVSGVNSAVANLASASSQVLPVWSQYVAAKQGADSLSQPTVNQSKLPQNLNGIGGFIASSPVKAALIAGGLLVAVVVLVKLVRK